MKLFWICAPWILRLFLHFTFRCIIYNVYFIIIIIIVGFFFYYFPPEVTIKVTFTMTVLSSCSSARSRQHTLVFWALPSAFSFLFSPQCLRVSVWVGLSETPPLRGAFVPVAMCLYLRRQPSSLGLRRFSCASRKSLTFMFVCLCMTLICRKSVICLALWL